MLDAAGLDPVEVRAYRSLVKMPAATPPELAHRLGLSGREAAALLDTLEAKGLVSRATGAGHRFRAAPPDLALGPILRNRQQELQAVQSAVAQLTEEYHSEARRRGSNEMVETITGATSIARMFYQLQRGAREEVLALCKPPNVAVPPQGNDTELGVLASGVRYRAVYERSALEVPPEVYRIREFIRNGEQARVAPELPAKLVIADRSLAMLVSSPVRSTGSARSKEATGSTGANGSTGSVGYVGSGGLFPDTSGEPSEEPTALLVQPGLLLDTLVGVFETLWAGAAPLILTEDGWIDEKKPGQAPPLEGLLLLSLLLTGLTDTAIAGQLGLSLRTVQRRIRDLMEAAGVQTRMQLAWEAARHGWL
ncbi:MULTISPECIES: helix-turn-helix domain-containing protein [unclassified Streptomyces]|uniref:helix-turn-helix domain-containing protein n=1 Tax=unclassified Streptomyces TaxID=2593676 RepID=UPI002E2A0FBE|nr:helix-turn-helix domain-containing protein [Streptomyces sp. NBC_00223]